MRVNNDAFSDDKIESAKFKYHAAIDAFRNELLLTYKKNYLFLRITKKNIMY